VVRVVGTVSAYRTNARLLCAMRFRVRHGRHGRRPLHVPQASCLHVRSRHQGAAILSRRRTAATGGGRYSSGGCAP